MKLCAITLDCSDPLALAAFYQQAHRARGNSVGLACPEGQDGGMAYLLWDDHVAWLLDPADGGYLPDGFVEETTAADWQVVLDVIEEQGWTFEYAEGNAVMPLPRAEAVLSRPADAECPSLAVWPDPGVCAIFRFLADERIDFDVDLRELQGQARLDALCAFLTVIGRRLGKSVLLFPEGGGTEPLLGFDIAVDRVRVMWTPPDKKGPWP